MEDIEEFVKRELAKVKAVVYIVLFFDMILLMTIKNAKIDENGLTYIAGTILIGNVIEKLITALYTYIPSRYTTETLEKTKYIKMSKTILAILLINMIIFTLGLIKHI